MASGSGKLARRDQRRGATIPSSTWRAPQRRCCRDGSCATRTTRCAQTEDRRGARRGLYNACFALRGMSVATPAYGRPRTSRPMHPMLTIAVKAARRAGNIINRGARDLDLLTVTSKGPKDFVSEVDRAAERQIVETLLARIRITRSSPRKAPPRARTPTPRTSGSSIRSTARRTSCTASRSTACRSRSRTRGQITQGVIYDPCPQRSVHRNPRARCVPQRPPDPRIAAHASARLPDRHRLSVPRRKLSRHLPADDEDDDRADGRAAAPGRRRARSRLRRRGILRRLLRTGPEPWDVAAGSLLVSKSGGLIGDLSGEGDYLHGGQVIAATPKMFAQMVNVLAPFRAALLRDLAQAGAARTPAVNPAPGSPPTR